MIKISKQILLDNNKKNCKTAWNTFWEINNIEVPERDTIRQEEAALTCNSKAYDLIYCKIESHITVMINSTYTTRTGT
jgi:hypothetical protein